MPPRKQKSPVTPDESDPKIWKENPPGPEQKELERLFRKGIIDSTDTPAKIRVRFQMFAGFPPKTFALHFRTTKARIGLYAGNIPKANGNIPELDGTDDESDTPPSLFKNVGLCESNIEARNFPFITWTYTDHEEKHDVVCVAVPMITGSRDVKFVLSEDGMQLVVEYVWPSVLLNPFKLFDDVKLLDGTPIPMTHPKVYAYQNRLAECDLSEKSRPGASLVMVINLPLKVQRELGTFRNEGLTCGDTKLVMVEFTAYQKKKVISDADTSINF